jgi:preprotein translocase subunit SecE
VVDDRDKDQGKGQERPSRPVTAAARRERRASARPANKSAASESKAARTSERDKKSDSTEKTAKAKSDADAKSGKAATKGDRKGRPTPARTAKDTRPGLFARLFRFLREVVAELRKVIWPTRKQMITYTLVVLVFVAFMVAAIFGLDLGLTQGIDALFG